MKPRTYERLKNESIANCFCLHSLFTGIYDNCENFINCLQIRGLLVYPCPRVGYGYYGSGTYSAGTGRGRVERHEYGYTHVLPLKVNNSIRIANVNPTACKPCKTFLLFDDSDLNIKYI